MFNLCFIPLKHKAKTLLFVFFFFLIKWINFFNFIWDSNTFLQVTIFAAWKEARAYLNAMKKKKKSQFILKSTIRKYFS